MREKPESSNVAAIFSYISKSPAVPQQVQYIISSGFNKLNVSIKSIFNECLAECEFKILFQYSIEGLILVCIFLCSILISMCKVNFNVQLKALVECAHCFMRLKINGTYECEFKFNS